MAKISEVIPTAWKALYSSVAAALIALQAVLIDETTFGSMSQAQWLMVVIAFLGVGGGTYFVPNVPKDLPASGKHAFTEL